MGVLSYLSGVLFASASHSTGILNAQELTTADEFGRLMGDKETESQASSSATSEYRNDGFNRLAKRPAGGSSLPRQLSESRPAISDRWGAASTP